MSRKPMDVSKYIIVDLESTCWENKEQRGQQLPEIIEVGVCLLDTNTYETTDKQSIYVKPERSTVSEYCFNLTGISQKVVDNKGIPLWQACEKLVSDYNSKNRIWGSWGAYDRRQFEKQIYQYLRVGDAVERLKFPFTQQYWCNIKLDFQINFGMNKQLGMDGALEMLGLELIGRHHCGADDSANISKIWAELLKTRKGVKNVV